MIDLITPTGFASKPSHHENENGPIEWEGICASHIHIPHKVNIKIYQEFTQPNTRKENQQSN